MIIKITTKLQLFRMQQKDKIKSPYSISSLTVRTVRANKYLKKNIYINTMVKINISFCGVEIVKERERQRQWKVNLNAVEGRDRNLFISFTLVIVHTQINNLKLLKLKTGQKK